MSVEHPAEKGEQGRTPFDRFSEAASNFASSPLFFAICVLIIALWAGSYLLSGSDKFHHISADAMAALTLLLVALLKNSEKRSEHAVQRKLDLIAAAMLEGASDESRDARTALEEAIGLHDEV